MNEISETEMLNAIRFAHEEIKKHCRVQKEMMKELGTVNKREYSHEQNDEAFRQLVYEKAYDRVVEIARSLMTKQERHEALDKLKEALVEELIGQEDEDAAAKMIMFTRYFSLVET